MSRLFLLFPTKRRQDPDQFYYSKQKTSRSTFLLISRDQTVVMFINLEGLPEGLQMGWKPPPSCLQNTADHRDR